MPSILRDNDGATFITPDYRELTSTKKASLLKKEVTMLAEQHGEFAHIRKKNHSQYEVAFSQEPGYLLGESVWHHFKKPYNMIYCELLPNETEVILVVVKNGSIYIDSAYPVDQVAEELVVFLPQQIAFDIYVYGDVPISEITEEGKFSFPEELTKSFTALDESLFDSLPLSSQFEMLAVSAALKKQGIGVLPVKQMILVVTAGALLWSGWNYLTSHKKAIPKIIISVVDPYALFLNTLASPAPDKSLEQLVDNIDLLSGAPGWEMKSIKYTNKDGFQSYMLSNGNNLNNLSQWAYLRHVHVEIDSKGVSANIPNKIKNRGKPRKIYKLQNVMTNVVDRINQILPGNAMTLQPLVKYSQYREMGFTIALNDVPPNIILLIAKQFKDLPLVFNSADITVSENGFISGNLTLTALGN